MAMQWFTEKWVCTLINQLQVDELAEIINLPFAVIPAKAGIR